MSAHDFSPQARPSRGLSGRQAGLSLWCWVMLLAVGGLVLGLTLRCLPVLLEYQGVVKAARLAARAETAAEARLEFDRVAVVEGLTGIKGADLAIDMPVSGTLRVSFSYRRDVPLFGPASLSFHLTGVAP